LFYPRCKAATEQGLADIGYADTIVFRPGFLRNTNRLVLRPVEAIAGWVASYMTACARAACTNTHLIYDEQADIHGSFTVYG
jgi:hypothetical protein